MCDVFPENVQNNEKSNSQTMTDKLNFDYFDLLSNYNEDKPLKSSDAIQSGSLSPLSFTNQSSPNQKHSAFLQNLSLTTTPSINQLKSKFCQIKSKSLRFLKVTNDLKNKIELLEEIYGGDEFKRLRKVNKLIQCNIDIDTSQKLVDLLISKSTNTDDGFISGRTIHPAYIVTDLNEDAANDSSTTMVDLERAEEFDGNSLFIEHEGNTYIRIDDGNYHLIRGISSDGIVLTETGLQLQIPTSSDSGGILHNSNILQQQQTAAEDQQQPLETFLTIDDGTNGNYFINDYTIDSSTTSRKNYHHNHQYSFQTNSQMRPYSDYVALPPRPVPQIPFSLSSQLFTPDLSITVTDRDCELVLTFDNQKRHLPQQQPIFYQIYSYTDEDRYLKSTSEVWSLIGEVKAGQLPMYCTVSIPSGVHKHYFAIRSVDELNRFSEWSNVVQVEVENNSSNYNHNDTNHKT